MDGMCKQLLYCIQGTPDFKCKHNYFKFIPLGFNGGHSGCNILYFSTKHKHLFNLIKEAYVCLIKLVQFFSLSYHNSFNLKSVVLYYLSCMWLLFLLNVLSHDYHANVFKSSVLILLQRIFNSFVYTEKISNGESEVQQVRIVFRLPITRV